MDISYCSHPLLEQTSSLHLPQETVDILRSGQNEEYLDTISRLALEPAFTAAIYTTHDQIFEEICSRWLSKPPADDLLPLAALSRILPVAPHLSVYARSLLKRKSGTLRLLSSQHVMALSDLPSDILTTLLLTLCRLLTFDNEVFAVSILPAQLQMTLHHSNLSIRYLSIRILCLYIHAADAASVSMINNYIGNREVAGQWENQIIDYTFFSLWEGKRVKDLGRSLHDARKFGSDKVLGSPTITGRRIIEAQEFSKTVACVSGILIPRLDGKDQGRSMIAMTETTKKNIRALAKAIKSSMPVLVSGTPGVGKTLMVKDLAKELGKGASMIILHLNEQTDAKSLIGMYTSDTPGSFTWRPGILTTAVMEGRWVFIEDLDRAPAEVVTTLLPLLERRELFVPNWGESVRADPGFKVIASARTHLNFRGAAILPTTGMIGSRHWLHVALDTPPKEELAEIALARYPLLRTYIPQLMNVYHALTDSNYDSLSIIKPNKDSGSIPSIGPQDLLKWCKRVADVLSDAGVNSSDENIPEILYDHIFLEAVDCFVGAFTQGSQRGEYISRIAQNLHLPPERMHHCIDGRKPAFVNSNSSLRVGRITLTKQSKHSISTPEYLSQHSHFAVTHHVARTLESIAATVKQAEPCLLVGETGTGKTTILQQLANAMNRKLTVVNLSQQSEAGDLLGGYKPVNMRALAVPMKEEFDVLMGLTSNPEKNKIYTDKLGRLILKGRWEKVLGLWQNVLRAIDGHLEPSQAGSDDETGKPIFKKRKRDSSKQKKLRSRWDRFSSNVELFKMHLASGSKGFAFSFIESKIVRAVRNGDWVLLDEINLAAPDTLESLADLLTPAVDDSPSILLTESGNSERIYAHPDFRIFGAMNPATDVGKHNLPSNLRSKFTELFVAGLDSNLDDLTALIKTYLGSHNHRDVRAATDIARLFFEIQRLSKENRLVDGANQKVHFSLRTLTRTLLYVLDTAPLQGLRRSIIEGFSMAFLTVLNKDSELLLQPLIHTYILSHQKSSQIYMRQTPRLPQDGQKYVQFRNYWLAKGGLPIENQDHYIITPFIERNLMNLVRAASTRRFPILLQGPTSSGKTSMIEYLAKISGNKFVRINNHEHTDLQEYLGSYVSDPDGRLQYQDGVLTHALREGSWVVLDELNLAPTGILEALNRLLDDNRELFIPETQQMIKPHANFLLFATQNPAGIYGGRKPLSRAFRNRFLELSFDEIPENELEIILCERSQIAPSFCSRIVTVYKRLSALRQSERIFEQKDSFATLRDLFRWALRRADNREQLAVNGLLLLAERVRKPEMRLAVKTIIEEVMKVKIDEDELFGPSTIDTTLQSREYSKDAIVWTKSMRRLFVLVAEALKNNEPVLLVGETGSGKTTICQYISEVMRTKLNIVNAHQNMETSDLIGAQRPNRNRDAIYVQLHHELKSVLIDQALNAEDSEQTVSVLLDIYERLHQEKPGSIPDSARLAIESLRIKANSMFEWADGSLINAMRYGEHFLIDEISLADDSVLERLNSVLEPGRTILLAEKGNTDEPVQAASGFQFLATMNPGGDYGKRELSRALRNRFTEIWVPNASSTEEICEIVQAKLAPQFSGFANSMVAFAAWYSATYGRANSPISIRDLLSWTELMNSCQRLDPRLTCLHGAAMVYLDGLGANPASKVSVADAAVLKERAICLSKLDQIFGHNLSSLYSTKQELGIQNDILSIGPLSLHRIDSSRQDLMYSLSAPTIMSNALKIVRALQIKKPILIEGAPGVGKTTLVAALASAIGRPLTRINLSDQTDLVDLFGSDSPLEDTQAGRFGWRDAPFLRAMQKGEWVLLDEMNLASQTVLEGLNACLDHRGQVYISELDQIFQRHPDFVVFAAQNPHHQGAGRKGLPASFVDRFTVVYADAFTSGDLMIISRQLFPHVNTDSTAQIVRIISTIGERLRQDRRFGAQGGPWEFNLRDILRWLHLITSQKGLLPLAKPNEFYQVLICQRFRRFEDGLTALNSIEHVSSLQQPRTCFHSKCVDLLEVGLALLPRDQELQPISTSLLKGVKTNMPILESVTLCVQNSWPSLLVGASGSGKSSLIFQLAASVGADVQEIPISSEMDTMDLIGGFEQLDPGREFSALVRRLRALTRRTIVQKLTTKVELSEELMTLEAHLQFSISDPEKIVESLRNIPEGTIDAEFVDCLTECELFLRNTKIDRRARFEWVDGVLVTAMRKGRWVILDNANLCNPSVLDRLNSLLEPDGVLSINEHCDSDGSPKVVRPHKDFRLFMTMDPCHGELSRAMRNRSIELFMPFRFQSPLIQPLGSICESSVSRFELFQAFEWKNFEPQHFRCLLEILLDHLTPADFIMCPRWEAQIKGGLIGLSYLQQKLLSSVFESYQSMLKSDRTIMHRISDIYEKFEVTLEAPAPGFASMQTIHPLNNPHLLMSSTTNPLSSRLHWLGGCFEILLEIYSCLHEPISFDETRNYGYREKTAPRLSGLWRDLSDLLRSSLEDYVNNNIQDHENMLLFVSRVSAYLRDVRTLSETPRFDSVELQVYRSIGREICDEARVNQSLQVSTVRLADALHSKIYEFEPQTRLSSGLCMTELWAIFRPKTAANISQLEFSLRIRDFADNFDALRYNPKVSVVDLEALQRSIVALHSGVDKAVSNTTAPLTKIQEALEDLKKEALASKVIAVPHFEQQFKILHQYKNYHGPSGSQCFSLVSFLSGGKTQEFMSFGPSSNGWGLFSQLGKVTAMGDLSVELASVRSILPISMLKSLRASSEVPLHSLRLLCTEIDTIGEALAASTEAVGSNVLNSVLNLVHGLQIQIEQVMHSKIHDESKQGIDQLLHQLGGNLKDKRAQMARRENLRLCIDSATNPHGIESSSTFSPQTQDYATCANVVSRFFLGCLILFVPNQPFDPALRSIVQHNRYRRRQSELEGKLAALREFETIFSGADSSYRIQINEKTLQNLGSEPELPLVARPPISEVANLQVVYSNIISNIVLESLDFTMPDNTHGRQENQYGEIKLLRGNIARAIAQLTESNPIYEDINILMIAMLRGLDAGLALTVIAGTRDSPFDTAIKQISEMTPLLCASPATLSQMTSKDQLSLSNSRLSLHSLKSCAIVRSIGTNSEVQLDRQLLQAFHRFYEEWKEQLSQDQRQAAAHSSLYRYRGSQEEIHGADEQDFLLLFPDYDNASQGIEENESKDRKQKSNQYNPRQQAHTLAELQREIFQAAGRSSKSILSLLRSASDNIAELWNGHDATSTSPIPPESLLPALVLNLEENKERLHGSAVEKSSYNFYTDQNILEAHKLIQLILRIQNRFTHLQAEWPEHAILGDVLITSSELLTMRHIEPLAKLLTKAEKLHAFIHEWQIVASKQYTAADLYGQLTEILISWRRLELSTWARLLDEEDEKCKDDADAWWFIAYEVIVAAPLSLIHDGVNLGQHAERLISTLSEFLSSTSVGQYSCRMRMIRSFSRHLQSFAKIFPTIDIVRNAVMNFIGYFSYFEDPIQEHISRERVKLRKDMEEIILLASWKDTNINALRDSARRSHHKLFKVVRKYRTLLAQTSDAILGRGIARETKVTRQSPALAAFPEPGPVDIRALEVCQLCVTGWSARPERFTKSASTAERMYSMGQMSSDVVNTDSHIYAFGTDLMESIRILRSETPSKATKENHDHVKHLKARKRKLYADTLKIVRQMGFRSNISSSALAKQASIAIIMATCPNLEDAVYKNCQDPTKHQYQYLLNVMPEIRQRARNPSDDLDSGEVVRSLGYLESMFALLLKQRATIANAKTDLNVCSSVIDKMENLWTPDSYTMSNSDLAMTVAKHEIHHTLKWIQAVSEASCVVIEKHSKLGGTDPSTVLSNLRGWQLRIAAALAVFRALPELPTALLTSKDEQVVQDGKVLLQNFKNDLKLLIESNPGLGFILRQVEVWIDPNMKSSLHGIKDHPKSDLEAFENSVFSTVDVALVATQRLGEALSAMPSSERGSRWLLRAAESLSGGLGELHSRQISDAFTRILSEIQSVGSQGKDDLTTARALCAVLLPVYQQYRNLLEDAVARNLRFYHSLCELTSLLANTFSDITMNGFCNPVEETGQQSGEQEKFEGGVGLGEGEGAEDISKDVQDDEDLAELAQEKNGNKLPEDIDNQDEAVNMDQDELEGEMAEGSENGEEDNSASECEEDNIDEGTGSVDDLDPSAVDEKLWDGKAENAEQKKQGLNSNGKLEKGEQKTAQSEDRQVDDLARDAEDGKEVDEEGADEGEEISKEAEHLDPHAQKGQNLQLPEEMDLDDFNDNKGSSNSSDMDGMSDGDQEQAAESPANQQQYEAEHQVEDETPNVTPEQPDPPRAETEGLTNVEGLDSPIDTEPSDDDQREDNLGKLKDQSTDNARELDDVAPSDVKGLGQNSDDNQGEEEATFNQANANKGHEGVHSDEVDAEAAAAAAKGSADPSKEASGEGQSEDNVNTGDLSQAFKKLGDALEKWHRKNKQINDATDQERNKELAAKDVDFAEQEVEHLPNEETEGDTQALGAATDEQARALNDQALESEMNEDPRNFPQEKLDQEGADPIDQAMDDNNTTLDNSKSQHEQSQRSTIIANGANMRHMQEQHGAGALKDERDIADLDLDLSDTRLQTADDFPFRPADEARRLWTHYEALTRDLSLALTEQLRLILSPTLATKMRGDFRTGKRLNIKRIIPYIASNYKRDKIWMRRTVPSKRNYQIMLAVDDSKSMGESGGSGAQLAFETLALVAKSLSMLEAGEISIVSFGADVRVAHAFDKPFSSEAGAQIFQHFGFRQTKTNIRKVVADSIALFCDAKRKSYSAGADLWQLELIISDGVCEDHDTIRRLVRQAQEERIMIVFVIVDALLKGESIMDMSQAVFEPDESGETKLKIKRYLDGFPFPYYLVVGDVKDLPGVLAQALRQWFAEVAGSG